MTVCCLRLSTTAWEHVVSRAKGLFLVFVLNSTRLSFSPFYFLASAHLDLAPGQLLLCSGCLMKTVEHKSMCMIHSGHLPPLIFKKTHAFLPFQYSISPNWWPPIHSVPVTTSQALELRVCTSISNLFPCFQGPTQVPVLQPVGDVRIQDSTLSEVNVQASQSARSTCSLSSGVPLSSTFIS